MHKTFLLAKILLKSGGSGLVAGKNGKMKWWLPILLIFAFGSVSFSLVMMTFGLFDMLSPLGAADIILPLALGAISVMIFFFGIFYVVSTMYHADDIETLMGLPLRPYHILGAKFITLVVYEYIIEAFMLLPILIAFAVRSGEGTLFYVYTAVQFLILPVIALAMATVIVMIVMRFTSFGKNKQAFKFVGSIIAMGLAIGVNIAIQTSVRNIGQDQIMAMVTGDTSMVSVISNIFPGIVFAANALIHNGTIDGLLNMLLFIVCTAGAAAVFLGVGRLVYFKGVAGVTETSAKRKGVANLAKHTISTPVIWSYVKKELRLLVRSPISFLNCVLMNFIWPVLIIVMFFGSGQSVLGIKAFVSTMDSGLLIAVIAGISAFFASANAITSTAISREGKALYFVKYIPVAIGQQLKAKMLTGMLLSGISILFLAGISIYLGVDAIIAVAALIISVAAAAASSYAGLLIDVANPKLTWMNEQQAIKQNVNVLLHMLLGVVLGAAAIVPVLLLGMSEIAAGIYTAVLFVLTAAVMHKNVNSYAVSKLKAMDA